MLHSPKKEPARPSGKEVPLTSFNNPEPMQDPALEACLAHGVFPTAIMWRGAEYLIVAIETVDAQGQDTNWLVGQPHPALGWQVLAFAGRAHLAVYIQHLAPQQPHATQLAAWWLAYAAAPASPTPESIHLDHLRYRLDGLQDPRALADDDLGILAFVALAADLAIHCQDPERVNDVVNHPGTIELEEAMIEDRDPDFELFDIEDFRSMLLMQLDWVEDRLCTWSSPRVGA